MKTNMRSSFQISKGTAVIAVLTVVMSLVSLATSAPPPRRTGRGARPARAARPRPARRPARHAPVKAHKKSVARRRVGTLRPVVVSGGTETVVVKEVSTDSADSQAPAETTTPAETKETPAASSGETQHAGKAQVPSDTDTSLADSPSYEVVGVEDNGLTIVVDVDGQKTKVRMIGLAEPQNDTKDQMDPKTSRPPKGRRGPRGGASRGAPRLPREIFLKNLENLLRGEQVYIVYDSMVEEEDEDGKYVAYVYRAPDGMLINAEVVRQGLGVVDPNYDFTEKDTFLYYQNKARQAQKGLWNKSKRGPGPRNGRRPREPLGKPEGMRK